MADKQKLVGLLYRIGFLQYDENPFITRAYNKAAQVIIEMSDDEFNNRTDFTDISGIGSAINNKILEFKADGFINSLNLLETYLENPFVKKNLFKIRKSGLITRRISYDDAVELLNNIKELYRTETDKEFICQVGGSVRRKCTLIGDLDVLVNVTDYKDIINFMDEHYHCLRSGGYESSYLVDEINNIQIDIMSTDEIELPFQLLYITGSQDFGIRIRGIAKSKGYKLNQKGLFDGDKRVLINGREIRTEGEIFKVLDITYVPPENR